MRNVSGLLEIAARSWPERKALVGSDFNLTYAELEHAADCAADQLVASDLPPSARLVTCLQDLGTTVLAMFAAWKAGMAVVPVHRSAPKDKIAHICSETSASVVWIDEENAPVVVERLKEARLPCDVWSCRGAKRVSQHRIPARHPARKMPRGPKDLAAILFTSGSTGAPKGVMLSHDNITFTTTAVRRYLNLTNSDVVVSLLPLSFTYGFYQPLLATAAGCSLSMVPDFGNAVLFWEAIRCSNATVVPLTPSVLALLHGSGRHLDPNLRVRTITLAGESLPSAYIPKLHRWFPSAEVYVMYGSTECSRVAYLAPDELSRHPRSVGKPIAGLSARLLDDAGNEVSAGSVGELHVSGPNVMLGYWSDSLPDPDVGGGEGKPSTATEHATGDLFTLDPEGFLYFVGRKDRITKVGGQRVDPAEVEAVLLSVPGVADALVVGVPHKVHGHILKASIVCDGKTRVSTAMLADECRRHLEPFKVPREFRFCPLIERTESGKIARFR
jgi:long-chain acyl-CoA synthetase